MAKATRASTRRRAPVQPSPAASSSAEDFPAVAPTAITPADACPVVALWTQMAAAADAFDRLDEIILRLAREVRGPEESQRSTIYEHELEIARRIMMERATSPEGALIQAGLVLDRCDRMRDGVREDSGITEADQEDLLHQARTALYSLAGVLRAVSEPLPPALARSLWAHLPSHSDPLALREAALATGVAEAAP